MAGAAAIDVRCCCAHQCCWQLLLLLLCAIAAMLLLLLQLLLRYQSTPRLPMHVPRARKAARSRLFLGLALMPMFPAGP